MQPCAWSTSATGVFCVAAYRIANADIKDKQPLMDARKSIEKDMERFKVCEREMKMAGRAGVPKAMDPKDRAKEEARDWINNAVENLQSKVRGLRAAQTKSRPSVAAQQQTSMQPRATSQVHSPAADACLLSMPALTWYLGTCPQVEEIEYEIEELQGNVKKKQKPPPRLTELEELATRHKEHISRLEKVLRCIDNEAIQPDELEQLKGDMDLYLVRVGTHHAICTPG